MSSFSISPSRKLEKHLLATFPIHFVILIIELYSLRQSAKVSWEFKDGFFLHWDLEELWVFEHTKEGRHSSGKRNMCKT